MMGTRSGDRWRVERQDVVLAVALTALVQRDVWAQQGLDNSASLVVAAVLFFGSVSVLWRRVVPLVTATAVAGALAGQAAVTGIDVSSFGWFLIIMLALYSVGAYSEIRPALAGLGILILGLLCRELRDLSADQANPWNFGFWTLLGVSWFGVGLYVRSRRRAQSLRHTAEQVEVAAAATARYAVAEERARIAHELHDVVAQDVSAVVVQAEAADALLDRQPELARESLHKIQRMGREALEEMRHVLGILDRDRSDAGDWRVPQPTLEQVGVLVERHRVLGLPVRLTIEGEPRPLPPGLEVSAYRVVQEALTNVRKHSPGSEASVTLAYSDVALTVDVVNQRTGAPTTPSIGGHGLIGMQERVRFFGGEFGAGPREAGGFAVHASFPTPARQTR
jgi:signal transduction histidine kinase